VKTNYCNLEWRNQFIDKEPNTPIFTADQIRELTDIVFLEEKEPFPCDGMFIFG
jgi:hypothetical protein